MGFLYNNGTSDAEYFYLRNIQGENISIYKDTGTLVGGYRYDAYGNHVVVNASNEVIEESEAIGEEEILFLNPFRYRGYCYDKETGLYYLNTRYYDPSTGRFISPDTFSILDETRNQINGLNLYMYCGDNPVMYVDSSGKLSILNWLKWVIGGVTFIAAVAITALTG